MTSYSSAKLVRKRLMCWRMQTALQSIAAGIDHLVERERTRQSFMPINSQMLQRIDESMLQVNRHGKISVDRMLTLTLSRALVTTCRLSQKASGKRCSVCGATRCSCAFTCANITQVAKVHVAEAWIAEA